MTVRNLEYLFRPASVAMIAEPDEPGRYAEVVLANLAAGGFRGPLMSINAKKRPLIHVGEDVRLGELEVVPDLAIIAASLDLVPSIIAQLGARGTRAVIVGPWMWHRMTAGSIEKARRAILEAARPNLVRVLGPGSGGIVVPAIGLNASATPVPISPGKIALVAQSTALTAAILDRANSKGIGFSTVLHLGSDLDIDLADVLDWLAADSDTHSILVQFDEVSTGRKFMSAARAAACNKPVISVQPCQARGRCESSGPFATADVYDAALRRAGWVAINTLGDLFEAIEAMARIRPLCGESLTILSNGHGLGRIAGDALTRSGGQLGSLSAGTFKHLEKLLQMRSTLANPLALPADVTPKKWGEAVAAVLADKATKNVLTVYSPSPYAPSAEVAAAICEAARTTECNVFTCWVGGAAMLGAQKIAAAHGVLSHESPEMAIAAFLGVVSYWRNRELLMQMPPSLAEGFSPDADSARSVIGEALAAGKRTLSARQARNVLQAYGLAVGESPLAGSIEKAIDNADEIGYPVDLALVLANGAELSESVSGLRSPAEIHLAARGLRSRARAQHPEGRISGYQLRPSTARSGAPALRLGVADDPVFGPVIYLGPASTAGIRDGRLVVALPPLNLVLAGDLVARSRFAEGLPATERTMLRGAVSNALVRLSQLLTDIDEVAAVEIDPLHVEVAGVVALEARISIAPRERKFGFRRFAIRPYPRELEEPVEWAGRKLLIRPIRPEDENILGELLNSLSPDDSRMRFFDSARSQPRSRLARFSQIDYDREMALVAIERGEDGAEHALGEVRAVANPGSTFAEFAIVIASGIKGGGLGKLLMQRLIRYCCGHGIGELRGETLDSNVRMQRLARSLGFMVTTGTDRGTRDLRLVLKEREG